MHYTHPAVHCLCYLSASITQNKLEMPSLEVVPTTFRLTLYVSMYLIAVSNSDLLFLHVAIGNESGPKIIINALRSKFIF